MSLTFLAEEFRQAGARVEESPVYEGASGKRYALALAAERGREFTIVFEYPEATAVGVLDAFRAAQDLQGRAVVVSRQWTLEARRWAERFRVRVVEPPEAPVEAVAVREFSEPEIAPAVAAEPEMAPVDDFLGGVAAHAVDLEVPAPMPVVASEPVLAVPAVDPVLAASAAHAVDAALPGPAVRERGLAPDAVARLARAERVEAEDCAASEGFGLPSPGGTEAVEDAAEDVVLPGLVEAALQLEMPLLADAMPTPADVSGGDMSEIKVALRLAREVLPLEDAAEVEDDEDDEEDFGATNLPWALPELAPAGAHLASLRGRTGLPWTPPTGNVQPERLSLVQDGDAAAAIDRLRGVRAGLEASGAHTFGHGHEDDGDRPASNWLASLRK